MLSIYPLTISSIATFIPSTTNPSGEPNWGPYWGTQEYNQIESRVDLDVRMMAEPEVSPKAPEPATPVAPAVEKTPPVETKLALLDGKVVQITKIEPKSEKV